LEDGAEVVEDLTALSSTSKSSPSSSSSAASSLFGRKKIFLKGSSQIFRRATSSKKIDSIFPSLEEVSQVSSLSSPFDSERGFAKPDERIELLAPTLHLKKGSSRTSSKTKHQATDDDKGQALSKFKKELAAKEAKIQYLETLVKELKSLYSDKLEMKDMELAALRKELKKVNEELSQTKESLTDAMDGQAQLLADISKQAKQENCWFPTIGSLNFS
jgi:type VI protein secretion system component VasK